MFKSLKRISLVVDSKTFVIVALAIGSMLVCKEYEIQADFPLTLISTAIIFPIVFSIGGAYKRRENALAQYGSIKAHGRALYLATRDWLPEADDGSLEKMRGALKDTMVGMRTLFTQPIEEMEKNEEAVDAAIEELSQVIKVELREKGLPGGECSRCNSYLSKMMIAFENIKHIYQYRTPRSLRAYSDFFIILLPVLYGPYFAVSSADYSPGLEYMMPALFAVILCGLDNIQDHLENPFDQIGVDDVAINAEKFVRRLEEDSAPLQE